jgi:hypothetical protein
MDFLGVKRDGQCYCSDGLDSFAAEAKKGLRRFFELVLVIAHFLKIDRKSISAWLSLSTRIFEMSYWSIWTVSTIESVWGNETRFTS